MYFKQNLFFYHDNIKKHFDQLLIIIFGEPVKNEILNQIILDK